MQNKEIIRKEIERRKKAIVDACGGCIVSQSNSIEYKVLCELAELIDFIDSMEEEAVCIGIGEPKEESGVIGEMIKEMNEEPVCEDLEEAARADAMVERSDDTEVGYDLNRYGGFIAGAQWQKKKDDKDESDMLLIAAMDGAERGKKIMREQMIDKACKYLNDNKDCVATEDNGIAGWIPDEFIEDFKKAMK